MTYSFFSQENYGGNGRATQGQLKFYLDLCMRKKVRPIEGIAKMTYKQLSNEIQKLQEYNPPTEGQKATIEKMIAQLLEVGIKVTMPKQIKDMTFDEASDAIQALKAKLQSLSEKLPPTEKQISLMVQMYYYPDADFCSELGVDIKIDLGDGLWRKMTPNEFAEELKKVRRNEASRFLDKHASGFYQWRKTRVTPEKIKYIRKLEQRLKDISTPRQVEFAITFEGETQGVTNGKVGDKTKEYNPTAYNELSDEQLMMMSNEQADEYIKMLKVDLKRKSYGSNEEDMTFEELRKERNEQERKVKCFTALNDMLYKLEAIVGYESEAREALSYLMFEDVTGEQIAEAKTKIREFMVYALDNEYVDLETLFSLCEEADVEGSTVAKQILVGKID